MALKPDLFRIRGSFGSRRVESWPATRQKRSTSSGSTCSGCGCLVASGDVSEAVYGRDVFTACTASLVVRSRGLRG